MVVVRVREYVRFDQQAIFAFVRIQLFALLGAGHFTVLVGDAESENRLGDGYGDGEAQKRPSEGWAIREISARRLWYFCRELRMYMDARSRSL